MKKALYITIYIISALFALFSILSVFRNADFRYFKLLDFPRIQFFISSALFLVVVCFITTRWKWYSYLIVVGLSIGLFVNCYYLIGYTKLVSVEVPTAGILTKTDARFSLLLINVKMSNKKSQPLLDLIALKKPDLILAMEVDKWWNKELREIDQEYPYSHRSINEVAYGMVLFSKFPLNTAKIKYLTNKNVPSLESTLTVSNGKKIKFHCIHPVPPTYFEHLPDNKGQEENALKKIGERVKNSKLPTIVAGDLNDAVWSKIDNLNGTNNILFDVRVGRGFFNSYNAEQLLMKWPLDHIFVTKEFKLKKLERLHKIGSDHYPIFVELVI